MLTAIVSFSLRFRGVVLALAVALLGYGLYTLSHARYDVFPDFAPPQAVIQTEAPGLSPEQVESLVTQPVENALNGVEGLESLRSSSIQGLSVVTVVFKPDGDLYRGRQSVVERLSTLAGTLPQGSGTPVLMPLTSATSTVLIVGITSGRRSLMDQRTLADWTLKPRLLAVPGVAKVAVYGGDVRQIQVQVLPATLIAYGLSLQEVLEATRRATGVQGAGFIEGAGQRVGILAEGQAVTAGELAKSALRVRDSGLLTLGDVARVVEAPAPSFGAALINGTTDVCIASRNIKPKELDLANQKGVHPLEHTVARDGIAIILNPDNPVSELTVEQIGKMYTGAYTNWNQVGGPDANIILNSRESSSGTYVFFQEHVLKKKDYAAAANLMPSNAAIVQAVSQDKYAIGYVGLGYATGAEDKVKILGVKKDATSPAVQASEAAVRSGDYPIARGLYIYTNGEAQGLIKKFLEFVMSPQGQQIVTLTGEVPVK